MRITGQKAGYFFGRSAVLELAINKRSGQTRLFVIADPNRDLRTSSGVIGDSGPRAGMMAGI